MGDVSFPPWSGAPPDASAVIERYGARWCVFVNADNSGLGFGWISGENETLGEALKGALAFAADRLADTNKLS